MCEQILQSNALRFVALDALSQLAVTTIFGFQFFSNPVSFMSFQYVSAFVVVAFIPNPFLCQIQTFCLAFLFSCFIQLSRFHSLSVVKVGREFVFAAVKTMNIQALYTLKIPGLGFQLYISVVRFKVHNWICTVLLWQKN